MKAFDSRFSAIIAKSNAISESTKLPECLTVLMLISNSYVSDAQRVSVLAAAASASEVENVATATDEQLLKSISYGSVASVVRQCERKTEYDDISIKANLGTAINDRLNYRFR